MLEKRIFLYSALALDQDSDVLANNVMLCPSEQVTCSLVVSLDVAMRVEGNDAFGGIIEDRLIGEITARIYQIGQQIKVTVYSVDKNRNRINFLPA